MLQYPNGGNSRFFQCSVMPVVPITKPVESFVYNVAALCRQLVFSVDSRTMPVTDSAAAVELPWYRKEKNPSSLLILIP
jgi:hypothetical protein